MNLDEVKQLERKRSRVLEAFLRIGKFKAPKVEECVPSPEKLGYRNKIQLPVTQTMQFGLYAKESHAIIPIEKCLIHCPIGEKAFDKVRTVLKQSDLKAYDEKTGKGSLKFLLIRTGQRTEEVLVILITKGKGDLRGLGKNILESYDKIKSVVEIVNPKASNVILEGQEKLLAGKMGIHEKILGKTFVISPKAFFQVNVEQAEQLYKKALSLADIQKDEFVLDAYCGVGTLSLFASDFTDHVVGVEYVKSAISDANYNAKLNNKTKISFVCGKVESIIGSIESIDVIFLNPPRKGCDPKVIDIIAKHKCRRIIYISCHPETLARDCALFEKKGYSLGTIYPFDMFPQTMHVESITSLDFRGLI